MPVEPTPAAERFWAKLRHDPKTGCWLWTGATNALGYGVIGRGRRGTGNVKAHRLAYELAHGAIPDGGMVLHRCDVPGCCNPVHLFVGTQADNMRDMSEKGRASCPAARLTVRDVSEIRRLRDSGASTKKLSKLYGVAPRQIRKIVSGKQWRHVD